MMADDTHTREFQHERVVFILPHHPPPSVSVSTVMERGVQQNDTHTPANFSTERVI